MHISCRIKDVIEFPTRQYQLAGKETTFDARWLLTDGLGMDHLTHVRARVEAHMGNFIFEVDRGR